MIAAAEQLAPEVASSPSVTPRVCRAVRSIGTERVWISS